MKQLTKFKINDLGVTDKQYADLPFARQLDFHKKIKTFKEGAKTTHVSQKRKTFSKAWKEFIDLYRPAEWFTVVRDDHNYRDDSFEVWYTEASN